MDESLDFEFYRHLERLRAAHRTIVQIYRVRINDPLAASLAVPQIGYAASRGGGGFLEPRRLCQIHPESVTAALIFARHLRGGMAELLLHIALVDFG